MQHVQSLSSEPPTPKFNSQNRTLDILGMCRSSHKIKKYKINCFNFLLNVFYLLQQNNMQWYASGLPSQQKIKCMVWHEVFVFEQGVPRVLIPLLHKRKRIFLKKITHKELSGMILETIMNSYNTLYSSISYIIMVLHFLLNTTVSEMFSLRMLQFL